MLPEDKYKVLSGFKGLMIHQKSFKKLKKTIESTSTNGQANSYWTNTIAVKAKNLENMQTNEQNKMNV